MNRLYELRTEKKLSQRDMAKILNISQGTFNNWENAKTEPSIEQLKTLSRFFEVSIDYLVGNSDDYGLIKIESKIDAEEIEILRKLDKFNKEARCALLAFINTV